MSKYFQQWSKQEEKEYISGKGVGEKLGEKLSIPYLIQ